MKIGLVLTLCVLECLQWTNALTLHLATCDKKSPIPKSPHVIYVDTGKIRKFDCEDGYVINIDKSLDFRCVYKDSGYNIISRKYPTLSASEIRCEAKKECRSLSLKENVKVIEKKRYKLTKKSMTYGDMKRTGYYDGDEIEFECKPSYAEMKPGSGDDIYGIYDSPDYSNETSSTYSWSCQHGGWKGIDDKDLDQPTCAPIQCDASRFEVIENGYVLNYTSKYDYLDSMNLLCNPGYRPVEGRDSAACFDSLSFTQLSLPAFGCEETRCPTPGTPLHGYFDCDNRFYTFGTNCTFSCKHGYDLVGNRQWTCMENGEWNEECVKCTHADQYCESPCIPVESEVVSMDQIFSRGSELEFTCIDKNVINGSVTRTCMRNRKWSGGDIDCLGTKIFSGDEALDFADSLEQRFLRNETNTTTDDRDDMDAIYVKTINADSDTCCDIYFLLDMSESMTDDDFEESKKFIKALLPRIGISNSVDSTSVALYLFAQKVKRIFDQHYPWMDPGNGFANYTEAAEVIDTLDRKNIIGEIGQATDLSLALEIIERSADTKRARREREEIGLRDNVLILLSDGDYTGGGEPEEVADNLKEKLAFQIYSIAIGKDPGRMNLVTMRRIASEDDPKLPKDKHFIAIDKKNLNTIIDNMIHKGTDTSTECGFTNPLLTGIRKEGPMDKSAEADAWPWMVQLRTNTKGVCGGSLIARQWILTAAHCVKDNSVTKIRSQSIAYESKSGVDYEINEDNIYSHPNYSRDIDPKHVYDVALIKLNKRVVLTKRLHTVCLWNSTYAEKGIPLEGLYESGKFGVVTGWGPRPGGDDHSDTLKQLQIELQTEDICSSVLSKTHVDLRHMFCAGSPDPDSEFYLDTCRGDSGGPFIVENPIKPDFYIQTGIVSVGAGCGEEENYGFYTKLSEDILNWIHKTMADNKN